MKWLRLFQGGRPAEKGYTYKYSEFKFAVDRSSLLKQIAEFKRVVPAIDGVIAVSTGGLLLGAFLARRLSIPCWMVEVEQRVKRVLPQQVGDPTPYFGDEPRITLGRASMPNGTYIVATGWLPSEKLIQKLQQRYSNCTMMFTALAVSEPETFKAKVLYGRAIPRDTRVEMFWETW